MSDITNLEDEKKALSGKSVAKQAQIDLHVKDKNPDEEALRKLRSELALLNRRLAALPEAIRILTEEETKTKKKSTDQNRELL